MKTIKKSRIAVILVIVVVLAAAIAVNSAKKKEEEQLQVERVMAEDNAMREAERYYGEATYVNAASTQATDRASEYFAEARINREHAKEEALDIIDDALYDAQLDEKERAQAAEVAEQMAQRAQAEAAIENLIKAKGFEECMVYLNGQSSDVVVKTDGLTANQAMQIKEIVTKQCQDCGVITITEVK